MAPSSTLPPDDRAQAALRDRFRDATDLLAAIAANRRLLDLVPPEERTRLLETVSQVHHPDRLERRRQAKAAARARREDRLRSADGVLHDTGIRALRRKPVVTTPNVHPPEPPSAGPAPDPPVREVPEPQSCYVCHAPYSRIHHFYDQLCPPCAELNFAKRTERADLHGRVALVTGGRVKIGYEAALKLLRSSAHVLVTTRFPRDSAMRYAREPDFEEWGHRLEIFGLDLRHTPSVEAFCRAVAATAGRLDFLVNNACQTVRRPPDFYAHLMAGEAMPVRELPRQAGQLLRSWEGSGGDRLLQEARVASQSWTAHGGPGSGAAMAARLSQVRLLPEELVAQADLFPAGLLDRDLQQVDLRARNSWRLLLAEVPTVELLEVHLVNAIAPFVLNARLKPLMLRTPERDKHIVNVSAVEGQFYRNFKTTRHPHTNMAKAALNMMTRTSATDYHNDGIHMNSVDTGWVTDEDPVEIAARKSVEHRFHPPLDIVDGAARIVDPVIAGFNSGRHVWGQFLKDYRPTAW